MSPIVGWVDRETAALLQANAALVVRGAEHTRDVTREEIAVSQPTQTCTTCGNRQVVTPDGRGFPPDIAKRRLAKRCKEAGHVSTPTYRAGLLIGPPVTGVTTPTEETRA